MLVETIGDFSTSVCLACAQAIVVHRHFIYCHVVGRDQLYLWAQNMGYCCGANTTTAPQQLLMPSGLFLLPLTYVGLHTVLQQPWHHNTIMQDVLISRVLVTASTLVYTCHHVWQDSSDQLIAVFLCFRVLQTWLCSQDWQSNLKHKRWICSELGGQNSPMRRVLRWSPCIGIRMQHWTWLWCR